MAFKRLVSTPVLIGGSFITLAIITWEVLQAGVALGALQVFAVPFVFLSALFDRQRVYLLLWGGPFLVFMVLNWIFYRSLPLMLFTGMLWFIVVIASEIIHQLAGQRRAVDMSSRRARELNAMDMTMAELSHETDLGHLLQMIVGRAADLLQASMGELGLYDKSRDDLEIVAHHPPDESQIGFRMKMGEGAMGHVAQTKKPMIVNRYKEWESALPGNISFNVEAVADVPLLKDGELVGVLGVGRFAKDQPFTDEDLHLLGVFARQALIAINNARLYKEIQTLAYTDMLTGINNRRRFFEILEKEYMRARRYKHPLSLLLLDIDHFKEINDRHGHVMGDAVLRWFAQECSQAIRINIDIIGRFGGEEFMILFPETPLDAACEASHRLLELISGAEVPVGDTRIPVTFSGGLVGLDHEGDASVDQLIEWADRALYLAKEKRSCVAYWDARTEEARLITAC